MVAERIPISDLVVDDQGGKRENARLAEAESRRDGRSLHDPVAHDEQVVVELKRAPERRQVGEQRDGTDGTEPPALGVSAMTFHWPFGPRRASRNTWTTSSL